VAVKSITVNCDWCEHEVQVDFNPEDQAEELFSSLLLPDEDWFHVEHGSDEYAFCSFECLTNKFS
jgi:hypothetical protein